MKTVIINDLQSKSPSIPTPAPVSKPKSQSKIKLEPSGEFSKEINSLRDELKRVETDESLRPALKDMKINSLNGRINRLENAELAENPKEYLDATRELIALNKEERQARRENETYDEWVNKREDLQEKALIAYFGEKKEIDSLKPNDKRGAVSNIVPSTLPRGDAPEDLLGFVDKSKVLMQRSPNGLERILDSGEFKNGFHDNIDVHGKSDSMRNARIKREFQSMDIPKDAKGDKRPVYAYMEHPDRLSSRGDRLAKYYGDVQIVFKDDIKQRSTMTIGDGLNTYNDYKATPVNDPKLPKSVKFSNAKSTSDFKYKTEDEDSGDTNIQKVVWVEAQTYGKVTTKDIAEVRIPKTYENHTVIEKLKQQNIPYIITKPLVKKVDIYDVDDLANDP